MSIIVLNQHLVHFFAALATIETLSMMLHDRIGACGPLLDGVPDLLVIQASADANDH